MVGREDETSQGMEPRAEVHFAEVGAEMRCHSDRCFLVFSYYGNIFVFFFRITYAQVTRKRTVCNGLFKMGRDKQVLNLFHAGTRQNIFQVGSLVKDVWL